MSPTTRRRSRSSSPPCASSRPGWRRMAGASPTPGSTTPNTASRSRANLLRRAAETGATEVLATESRRMAPASRRWRTCRCQSPFCPTTASSCSAAEFARWAEGRKQLRMEFFYREMRRKTGLLMEGDAAGRRPVELRPRQPQARQARPASARAAALRARRGHGRGARPRRGPLSGQLRRAAPVRLGHRPRGGAEALPTTSSRTRLPRFGDYQDAMLAGDPSCSTR